MPIYEYQCGQCGAREERLQPLGAPESHDCPGCSAREGMRRMVSRTGFILSGEGWYAGGYGGGGKGKDPAPAAPGDAKDSSGCAGGCACHGTSSGPAASPEAATGNT